MIRIAALAVALVACNQVVGLKPTQLGDGPPPDAPFACPPPGTPLAFSRALHQVLARVCFDVTISSAGDVVASCPETADPSSPRVVYEGTFDALQPIGGVAQGASEPRLSPDGDELIVLTTSATFVTYTRSGTGWAPGATLPFSTMQSIPILGQIARGPRIVLVDTAGAHEWARSNGAWTEIAAYTANDFGLQTLGWASLGIDGLRLVIYGQRANELPAMFYAERSDVNARFGQPVALDGVPALRQFAFLTEDCARLYISGLERVFYEQQR